MISFHLKYKCDNYEENEFTPLEETNQQAFIRFLEKTNWFVESVDSKIHYIVVYNHSNDIFILEGNYNAIREIYFIPANDKGYYYKKAKGALVRKMINDFFENKFEDLKVDLQKKGSGRNRIIKSLKDKSFIYKLNWKYVFWESLLACIVALSSFALFLYSLFFIELIAAKVILMIISSLVITVFSGFPICVQYILRSRNNSVVISRGKDDIMITDKGKTFTVSKQNIYEIEMVYNSFFKILHPENIIWYARIRSFDNPDIIMTNFMIGDFDLKFKFGYNMKIEEYKKMMVFIK